VKLRDEKRGDPTAIQSVLIDRHDGSPIPLGQLAQVEEAFGPSSIRGESGSRRIAVEAKVHERDLGSTAREIRERVAREVSMPTGYFFDVGGRVESQARASRALSVAIGIALVSVFLLLYLALGSFSDAAVILGTLPVVFVAERFAGPEGNHRSCRTPLVDDIQDDFHGDKAKLEWVVSLDGKKKQSETYRVLAILDKPKNS
jgi:Cu/Ag efflux pump CusA